MTASQYNRSTIENSVSARRRSSSPRKSSKRRANDVVDFEPAESVGRESLDESVLGGPAVLDQNEGSRRKRDRREDNHRSKGKKKVYYAINNESMSSRGGYYENNSNEFRNSSGGQMSDFNSNQYSGSDKEAVERIQKSIRNHSDVGSRVEEHMKYQLKEGEADYELRKQRTGKYAYKDAMRKVDVFAYAVGHLANDLVI
jgi:hypothetical protein